MIRRLSAWFSHLPTLFRGLSLKSRLILLAVGLLVAFMWVLALVSATLLRDRVEHILSDEQYAITQRIAADLDGRLQERIAALSVIAGNLPAEFDHDDLQAMLAQRPLLHLVFTAGVAVFGLDGRVVANYPPVPDRRGIDYSDRDYFRAVVATGRPHVDKPIMGRALKRPVLNLSVPVLDDAGKVRGVMTGTIDLTKPSFLGVAANPEVRGQGEFAIYSLGGRMVVAAGKAHPVMETAPPPGMDAMFDRFAAGYEGSGVGTGADGVRRLYSGVRLRSADWLVLASLPAEVAFAPIAEMEAYLLAVAAVLTLLAVVAIRHTAGRVLAPLEAAGRAMQGMTLGLTSLAPLPAPRDDEVGRLIGHFNRLLADRQQYEAALAESELRFRALVESAPDAIFVQTDGGFAYANRAGLKLLGAAGPEELLGREFLAQVHPDFRPLVAERIRVLNERRESVPLLESVYLRLDGTPVAVEVSAVPARYGSQDGSIAFVRDITLRKKAEEELKLYREHLEKLVATRTADLEAARLVAEGRAREAEESEQRYRLLVEQSVDGIFVLDPGGRCVDVNSAGASMLGYEREELLHLTIPEVISAEEMPRLGAEWARLEKGVVERSEWRIRRRDGSVFHGEAVGRRLPDGRLLTILRDITERKRAEATRRAGDLARGIMATQEEERRRLSQTLHDTTSPNLAAISINLRTLVAELAAMELGGPLSRLEDTRALLEDTATSIRDICYELRPAALDHYGLVPAIAAYAQQFQNRTGITVEFDSPELPARLPAETETAVFRIVQEALTNCAKHSYASRAQVSLEPLGAGLRLTIADNGIGFDLDKLAQPGLGLLTMKDRAELAGGCFRVDSSPGTGTRVEVEI